MDNNKKQDSPVTRGKKKSFFDRIPKKKLSGKNKIFIGTSILLLFLFGLILSFYLMGSEYLNLINKESDKIIANENATVDPNETVTGDNVDDKTREQIEKEMMDAINNGTVMDESYVKNILLIGTDVRVTESWNGNSDSMILISINSKTHKIYMTSFMRDLYVYVPVANKFAKLNYAHAYGGSTLLCQTITNDFKIKVDQYFRVDFYGLMKVIDAAGGVNMEVTQDEIPVANKYIDEMAKYGGFSAKDNYLTTAGNIHLNGVQAVAYSRIRYVGNADYERTNRQRKVLAQVFENCKSMGVSGLDSFANNALPNLYTNMSNNDIWSMISDAVTYLGYDIVSQRVPFDGMSTSQIIDSQGMIVPDLQKNIEMLIDTIYSVE